MTREGDLISRQAVIDACEQSINILEAVDRIMDLPSVKQEPKTEQEDDYFRKIVEVAISQLRADRDRLEDELAKREQESCEDTISRQAVLNLIEHYNSDGLGSVFYGYEEGVKFANAVNKLPPVNPHVSCEDAVSRQAVDTLVDELARAISDERCCISRGRSTATIMQDILELPPVNPQEPTDDATLKDIFCMGCEYKEQEPCDKCEVGNPCLYCKHEFEPQESEG